MMRLIYNLLILSLGFLPSSPNPLTPKTDKSTPEKVFYKETINSNHSSTETVEFLKLTLPSPEVEPKIDRLKFGPAYISKLNSSTSSIKRGIIQRVESINLQPNTGQIQQNSTVITTLLENSTVITAPLDQPDPDVQLQESQAEEDAESDDSDQRTLFHFRGPGLGRPPPPRPPQLALQTMTTEDEKARQAWGGNCLSEDWKRCSTIDGWGGDYYIKDKKNPGKFILKKDGKIPCVSAPRAKNVEKTYCLNNGFTVARCHILCMSECNNDYRNTYKLVRHEGQCANPLLGG